MKNKYNYLNNQEIIKKYKEYQSVAEVARYFGVPWGAIKLRLYKEGIEIENSTPKNIFNDKYFSKTDTRKKVYWLGYLCGHHSIDTKRPNTLMLSIKKDNEEHIHKLLMDLDFEGNVACHCVIPKNKNHKENCISSAYLTSARMLSDLGRYGILPMSEKKRLYKKVKGNCKVVEFPKSILSHKYLSHFCRGYFDGNGSMYACKRDIRGKEQYDAHLEISGTKRFLSVIQKILEENAEITNCKSRMREKRVSPSDACCLKYVGNNQIIKIMKWLYKDANIFHKEKRDVFEKHLAWHKEKMKSIVRIMANAKKITVRWRGADFFFYISATNDPEKITKHILKKFNEHDVALINIDVSEKAKKVLKRNIWWKCKVSKYIENNLFGE